MRILAVSDTPSPGLENMISRNQDMRKKIDLILSCGDLGRNYIEFLVDGLNRELYFVRGNHEREEDFEEYHDGSIMDNLWAGVKTGKKKRKSWIAGQHELHGRMEVFKEFIIAGFGGSGWYGGKGNEYREGEMFKIVLAVSRKIRWYNFKQKLLRRPAKELLVITHAPIYGIHDEPDPCHNGFKCFGRFLKAFNPVLWLHGHVHLPNGHQNQITISGNTTVINVTGHKFINIRKNKIDVSYKFDILDK